MPRRPLPRRYRLDCGCGFAVEGDEDEVVDAARRHAEHAHGIQLADGIVRALARPLPDGHVRSTDRDHGPGGAQG